MNPNSLWSVVAVRGTVSVRDCSGATWDVAGGLPDPQFCMTINGEFQCTEEVSDSLTPAWTMNRFPVTTASELLRGVQISYRDADISAADGICEGRFTFVEADFARATATMTCDCPSGTNQGTVFLRLEPQ